MMFLLTQSSNNIALLNLANIGFRQRNAQTALEKNAAKKNNNNRTAFKEIFSRLFTGLNINNEEVQKITGGDKEIFKHLLYLFSCGIYTRKTWNYAIEE